MNMTGRIKSWTIIAGIWTLASVASLPLEGAEPGWSSIVLPTGDYRKEIKSMPIEVRPYRPLHFYGNAVRRNHYRGNPLPAPRDLRYTVQELVRREG
jgi:hypothetical protein